MARASPGWTSTRTPRAQDEIWARAIHRSLYNWDSAANKPVLELASAVTVSDDGLAHTFKLRDDAFFHHGRKDDGGRRDLDVHAPDGRLQGLSGARFVRMIKGAVEVEKGQAQAISGLQQDRRLDARDDAHREGRPGYYFMTATPRSIRPDEAEKESLATKPIGLGPFKFVEHVPGSRSSPSASRSSTSRASPTPTRS
jgi:peptide/nickel transport system substrate-binding protein